MKYPLKSRVKYKVTSDNIKEFKCHSDRRYVYIFTFPDKSIYIGLTKNLYDRIYSSRSSHFKSINSAINNHLQNFKESFKLTITSKDPIDAKLAALLENDLILYYKQSKKVNVLNKAKGGSLGGSKIKWTKEKCIIEAKKYKTKKEWNCKSCASYSAANKNNWMSECDKHIIPTRNPEGFWSYERCRDEAKKYTTRSEWQKNSITSYSVSHKNKWLNEFCKHMIYIQKPNGYWNYDSCMNEAKKYTSIAEWYKNNVTSCRVARKNNWYDDCVKHMLSNSCKKQGYWTFDKCKEEALKYNTKMEWMHSNGSSYTVAYNNDWLDLCTNHMIIKYVKKGYWTLDLCKKEAMKYDTRSEWKKYSGSSYTIANRNKWAAECTKHMK